MTFKDQFLIKKASRPAKLIKALKWDVWGKTKHKTYESPKNSSK